MLKSVDGGLIRGEEVLCSWVRRGEEEEVDMMNGCKRKKD
jgi:hypothetical protein